MCAKKKKVNPLKVAFPGQKPKKVKLSKTPRGALKANLKVSEGPRKDPEQEKFNEALLRALENHDCLRAIRNAVREERAGSGPYARHLIT